MTLSQMTLFLDTKSGQNKYMMKIQRVNKAKGAVIYGTTKN